MRIFAGLLMTTILALATTASATTPVQGCQDHALHDTDALFSRDALRTLLDQHPRSPVAHIEAAEQICAVHQIDASHLLLESDRRSYLLTVRPHCGGLPWARRVGIAAPNGEIWRGFDAVSLDGRSCDIQTIERLSG